MAPPSSGGVTIAQNIMGMIARGHDLDDKLSSSTSSGTYPALWVEGRAKSYADRNFLRWLPIIVKNSIAALDR